MSHIDAVMAEIEALNNGDLSTPELIDAFNEIISDLEFRVQALRDDLKSGE